MEEQANPANSQGGDGPDKHVEQGGERPGGGGGRNRNRNRNRGRDRNRDRQPQGEGVDGETAESVEIVDGQVATEVASTPRPPQPLRETNDRPDRPPRDNAERGDRPPRDTAERGERPPREPRPNQSERGGQDRQTNDRQRDGRNERSGPERNRDRGDRQSADRQRENRNERSATERPVRVASPDFYIDKDDDISPADLRPVDRVRGGSVFEQYDDEPARMIPAALPALSDQERLVIGITLGDYNGVGPEVILKALQNNQLLRICTPIIYGSMRVLNRYRNLLNMKDWTLNGIQHASQASHKHTNVITCFSETIPVPVSVGAAKPATAAVAEPIAAADQTEPESGTAQEVVTLEPSEATTEVASEQTPAPVASSQTIDIQPGKVTPEAGAAALACLNRAVEDLKAGHLHAIVTAPINKHNIQSEAFTFPGHTEYLANAFGVPDDLMFMVSENLKIGVVTGHVPLGKVRQYITKPAIQAKLEFMFQSLKQDFGIDRPKIAVLGLNPHAGENGLIGHEEKDIITPLINELRKKGELLYGPFPADGFFGTRSYRKYDAVLAMYHDQGLIPFKAIAFEEGVNFTAGLPIVRTSPDHGTAYDIAGKGLADETSMIQAIYTAVDVARRRKEYQELAANALKK